MNDDTLTRHFSELQRSEPRPLAADVDLLRVGGYRGYAEMVGRWTGLARGGARVEAIGESLAGAPLFAVDIGSRSAERVAVIMAGIHPLEWIGVEIALEIFERLASNPPANRRIIGFPLVNVDGYRQVESDLRLGLRRFRRGNGHGVDLNRNWPTNFATSRHKLVAGWNQSGPRPLSEPETAAVATRLDLVAASARIDRAVSLHSIGRMILLPYGGRWAPPADWASLRRAGQSVKAAIPEPYTIRQTSHWLPGMFAHGMELDHLHAHYGATAMLIECSLGGVTLRDPRSLLHPFRWFNPRRPEPIIGQIATALEPFLRTGDR